MPHFNSRPSARGDVGGVCCLRLALISIHAPPRGATTCVFLPFCPSYFNSRPSARGDCTDSEICYTLRISIHAPPRGATFPATARLSWSSDFNSRPSARGDHFLQLKPCVRCISIHAPPRGATQYYQRYLFQKLFQFTPLREGRPDFQIIGITPYIFQFTPLREGRHHVRVT